MYIFIYLYFYKIIKNEDREKKLKTRLKSINEAFEKFDVNNEL